MSQDETGNEFTLPETSEAVTEPVDSRGDIKDPGRRNAMKVLGQAAVAAAVIPTVLDMTGCGAGTATSTGGGGTPPITTPSGGSIPHAGEMGVYNGYPNLLPNPSHLQDYNLMPVEPELIAPGDTVPGASGALNNTTGYASLASININKVNTIVAQNNGGITAKDQAYLTLYNNLNNMGGVGAGGGFLKDPTSHNGIKLRPPGTDNVYMVDLTNPTAREYMRQYLVGLGTTYPKGVFLDELDTATYVEYAEHVNATTGNVDKLTGKYDGLTQGALTLMNTVCSQVRAAGKQTVVNGGFEQTWDYYYNANPANTGKAPTQTDPIVAVAQNADVFGKEQMYQSITQTPSGSAGSPYTISAWQGADAGFIQSRISDYLKARIAAISAGTIANKAISILGIEPSAPYAGQTQQDLIRKVSDYYQGTLTGLVSLPSGVSLTYTPYLRNPYDSNGDVSAPGYNYALGHGTLVAADRTEVAARSAAQVNEAVSSEGYLTGDALKSMNDYLATKNDTSTINLFQSARESLRSARVSAGLEKADLSDKPDFLKNILGDDRQQMIAESRADKIARKGSDALAKKDGGLLSLNLGGRSV